MRHGSSRHHRIRIHPCRSPLSPLLLRACTWRTSKQSALAASTRQQYLASMHIRSPSDGTILISVTQVDAPRRSVTRHETHLAYPPALRTHMLPDLFTDTHSSFFERHRVIRDQHPAESGLRPGGCDLGGTFPTCATSTSTFPSCAMNK